MKKIKISICLSIINLLLLITQHTCWASSPVIEKMKERFHQKKQRKEKKNQHTTTEQQSAIQEKPIAVFMYTHNTSQTILKSLDSVLNQHYNNYRILLVDDASTDNTIEKAKKHLARNHSSLNVQVIALQQPQGKLKAMHTVLNTCKDEEIIVLLDARDWLAHDKVLNNLNKEYSERDIWITFGTATSDPKGCNIGLRNGAVPNDILKKRHFRKIFPYMPAHTFYAWLFKLIKKEDLIDPAAGDFYQEAAECYIMWPLMEMANTHFKTISETTYVINCNDPITKLIEDYHLRMACNAQIGRNIPIYSIAVKPYHLNGAA